ncbi:MAG TPA: D-alanine--D-alanine ligase, partial [candidate division Zixibacteria bacterium]|nr:D-alanine--D-alanine ligase [candidate division Zixibacteria bacterium]
MGKTSRLKAGSKVAVLCGGTTSEREVSLKTGRALHNALLEAGWHADYLDWPESDVVLRVAELATYDLAFVGYHGGPGESGKVAAVLELAGIPYTGSGPAASEISMDKLFSKRFFDQAGIVSPPWLGWELDQPPSTQEIIRHWEHGFPIVVKPANEGSTVGITIAETSEELGEGISAARRYDKRLLFEKYIPGRELTYAVIEGIVTRPVEIIPKEGFYDFEHKYTSGASEYVCPADIPENVAEEIRSTAEKAFALFGLRQYARADFRFDGDRAYCLEINSLPGMTSLSLVPMAAKEAGLSFV